MTPTDQLPSPAALSPPAIRQWRAAAFLVGIVAVIAYLNTLPGEFVLDDIPIVAENPRMESWKGAVELLHTNYWESLGDEISKADRLWRPTTMLSFWANERATGPAPWGFHFINLILHAVVSLCVCRIARRLGLGIAGAGVAGVLFALHPIHTEAVANVVGRAELLAAVFFLIALDEWFEASQSGRVRHAVWIAPIVFLGLTAKENVATYPLVIALAAWVFPRTPGTRDEYRSRRNRLLAIALVASLAAIGIYLLLRTIVLGSLRFESPRFIPGLLYQVPLTHRCWTAFEVFARYFWLIVWPLNLSADYSYNAIPLVTSLAHGPTLAGIGIAAAMIACAIGLRRRAPAAAFGCGFYLVAFALTSNFLFPIKTLMAERLAYLPSAGLAWAAAAGAEAVWRRAATSRARTSLLAIGIAVALVLLIRTVDRNVDWTTNERLFLSITGAQPQSARGHFNLGDVYRVDHKEYAKAIESYRKGLEIFPNDPEAHLRIAVCHARLGQFEPAIQELEKALELDPTNQRLRDRITILREQLKPAESN